LQYFEASVNSLANGKVEVDKSAADIKVDEIVGYIHGLEKQMSTTIKHSELLVKRSREISQAMFELGQTLSSLGQSENDAIGSGLSQVSVICCSLLYLIIVFLFFLVLVVGSGQMGTTIDSLSAMASSHAEAEAMKFLEPMDEYARMINSIKSALHQRQLKKDIYAAALADYEAKQSSYRKYVGVPGKESSLKGKEQAMQTAKEVHDTTKIEFEAVTDRLLVEFDAFKSQRALDMKEIMVDFIQLQVCFLIFMLLFTYVNWVFLSSFLFFLSVV
jgi:hypothetical protein